MAARDTNTASATRSRRHRDPRLLIGLALVGVSVLGVVGVVTAVDDGVEVYAAPSLLTIGQRIDASDLELRRVSLGADDERLPARGQALPDDGRCLVSRAVRRRRAGATIAVTGVRCAEHPRPRSVVAPWRV